MTSQFNVGYVESAPAAGLIQAIRETLNSHRGRENAIGRSDLLEQVKGQWWTDDRSLRKAINFMRKQGELILSTGGDSGGYWLPASREETEDYVYVELLGRAKDLEEQARKMLEESERRWPPKIQPNLF